MILIFIYIQVYYKDNPKVFASSESAFLLGYSVLMLHTNLHHQNIDKN